MTDGLGSAVVRGLPIPLRERWQPLRLGLVDIFHYDYEEFWFRDGHLLLRGNNGTGKSKVLALTLPFLLDAALAAHRVEPDGDPSKRMEWNLLLGGRYDERLGYSWLEFGRLDAAGEPQFCTIGCGLKAVTGKGIADHWFFLTGRRVGVDLFLVGPSGTAMTRERLEEQLGSSGRVLRNATHYRRAVDETLFQLGEQRYEALVNLLVQLRQPQLSKRPDEARLSVALSEALPPLHQDVLLDVAAAFHDLEQQREELSSARDTARYVGAFRVGYRRYASVLARRQGAALRPREAEMAKLLENTYRHVNIALVNEMAKFCHELGIDLWDVIHCAGTKPFGFQAFYPGPGVGGHCIPVDPKYLSHNVQARLGYPFRFVELAQEINASMPTYVTRRAQNILNEAGLAVNGSNVLLLGVTYKPNISDQRESPAGPPARALGALGAKITYQDPHVHDWAPGVEVVAVADIEAAVVAADLVVLVQNHREYDVDALARSAKRFLDTRGVTTVPEAERL